MLNISIPERGNTERQKQVGNDAEDEPDCAVSLACVPQL